MGFPKVVGALLVSSVCACGLGLAGAESADGGAVQQEAGASVDGASSSDAGSTPDALVDGAFADVDAAAEAGATTWCQGSTHKLCVDFDEGNYGGGTSDVSANGTIALDSDAVSAPGSFKASFATSAADNRARLAFPSFSSGGLSITLDMRIKIDSIGSSGGLTHLFSLQDADPNVYAVRLSVDSSGRLGLSCSGNGAPSPSILKTPAPTGWFHVVVLMTPTGVTVSFDGELPQVFLWAILLPSNPKLELGLVGSNSVPTTVHFDNVTID